MKKIIITKDEFNTIRNDRAGDFSEPCKEFDEYTPYIESDSQYKEYFYHAVIKKRGVTVSGIFETSSTGGELYYDLLYKLCCNYNVREEQIELLSFNIV